MEIFETEAYMKIFHLEEQRMSIYLDSFSNLFYRIDSDRPRPIHMMPWRLQKPFYFAFLANQRLAERFKDMEPIGAIDLFLKNLYCTKTPFDLDLRKLV